MASDEVVYLKCFYDEGYCGSMRVSTGRKVNLDGILKVISMAERGERIWAGAFENPSYMLKKDLNAYQRMGSTTHVPYKMEDSGIFSTNDGGRFICPYDKTKMIQKNRGILLNPSIVNREGMFRRNDLETLSQELGKSLELCGVPPINTERIRLDVFEFLELDRNGIVPYDSVDPARMIDCMVKKADRKCSELIDMMVMFILVNKKIIPDSVKDPLLACNLMKKMYLGKSEEWLIDNIGKKDYQKLSDSLCLISEGKKPGIN
ncbi:MAG: hypothetical protein WCK90_03475 [archaeon]